MTQFANYGGMVWTYVGVPPDLLDDLIIEATGVAQEAVSDLVGMLDTAEDIITDVETAPPELCPLLLALSVDLLDPRVVLSHSPLRNILLEPDDVVTGNRLRARRR